jgi:hypothetical protein
MVYGGNRNFTQFFNMKGGPVHHGEAMDFEERFMIANFHLDGYNNADIARLVMRSEAGVKNIIDRFVDTGQLCPKALNDASRPPLLQLPQLLYLKVLLIISSGNIFLK